ncbi:AMP-binding enzyme [Corynebacterium terpenotabidum]|uniref:AMP-binding enzyme n=1 Tax=Corynebacterium terpenotabidum TaxID=89154 RepID=UPI001FE13F09|nr:hypothetical protein [Corynebacterium terpenotabidum]
MSRSSASPTRSGGEAVTAVVVLREGAPLAAEDLQDWLRGHLAGFKIPKVVSFTDVLPRNATGKVLKRQLREEWTGTASAVSR